MKYLWPAALLVTVTAVAIWLLRDAPQVPTESAAAAKRTIERRQLVADANLAEAHYQGRGARLDKAEAVRLFERAAQGGIEQAWQRLGDIYSTGDGVPVNPARAVEAWRHVRDVRTQMKVAFAHWAGWGTERNPAAAVAIWQRLSEDVESKYWLGEALMAGEGVPRDPAKAVELWQSVCSDTFVRDCWHAMCRALADGTGVERDVVAAAPWCRKSKDAVDRKPPPAPIMPSSEPPTYSRVRVEKMRLDAIDAQAVLERSAPEIEARARKGEAAAQFEFAVRQADEKAKRVWLERAAAQGHAEAAKIVEQLKRQASPFEPRVRQ